MILRTIPCQLDGDKTHLAVENSIALLRWLDGECGTSVRSICIGGELGKQYGWLRLADVANHKSFGIPESSNS